MNRNADNNANSPAGRTGPASRPVPPAPGGTAPATLGQLALTFLKIGAIGFGGWMAMIALMEQDYVRRRRYLDAEEFLHGVGLSQLLGSFSVNTAMFIGYRLFGPAGLFTAFVCFLAPSVALILGLSWVYFTYHTIPALQGALAGIGPVIISLVLQAGISIARKGIRSWIGVALAVVALVLNVLYVNPIWILLGSGLVGVALGLSSVRRWAWRWYKPKAAVDSTLSPSGQGGPSPEQADQPPPDQPSSDERPRSSPAVLPLALPVKPLAVAAAASAPAGGVLWLIGSTFLKIGCVFFGGGFVLVPLMHRYMVEQLGWLTTRQFSDGVAMSQITPGPIAILSTFAGFKMAGIVGGLLATICLYIPSIVLMLAVSHYYRRLHHLAAAQDFLAGVVPAVVGLVAAAVIILTPDNIHLHRPFGIVLAAVALWLFQRNWHPVWVLGLGAVLGVVWPGLFVAAGG